MNPLLTLLFLSALPPTSAGRLQDPAEGSHARAWTQAELEAVSDKIKDEIEAMRGMKYTRPVAVKVTDKKGFLEYARKRMEVSQTPERMARDETVAHMLGLIPPDMDLEKTLEKVLQDQVGGFYDPGSDTFYLMDSFTGDIAKIILSHELTHALDDQHFDIDKILKGLHEDTDAELAFQAVVEGSGTAAMNQWTVKHMFQLSRKDMLESANLGTEGLEDAPPYIWKPLLAVYLRGEQFLKRGKGAMAAMLATAKTSDIQRAFESPPRSSEQILHPEKYWDEKQRDEPRRIEFDLKSVPASWTVLGQDTLGEMYLALLTTPPEERKGLDAKDPMGMLETKFTNKAAEGWGGDRLILLGKGDERCLQMVTVWDSPGDASEFREALVQRNAERKSRDDGQDADGGATLAPIELLSTDRKDVVVVRIHPGPADRASVEVAWREIE